MGVSSTAALVERIYEVLVDGSGVTRTLASGERFARLRTSKMDRRDIAIRAKSTPLVEVVIGGMDPDGTVARVMPDEHLWMLPIRIYRFYFIGFESDPSRVQSTIVRMIDDTMRVAAALEHPSNLVQTEEAEATGIGSTALQFQRARLDRQASIGDGRDRLATYVDEYVAAFDFAPDA